MYYMNVSGEKFEYYTVGRRSPLSCISMPVIDDSQLRRRPSKSGVAPAANARIRRLDRRTHQDRDDLVAVLFPTSGEPSSDPRPVAEAAPKTEFEVGQLDVAVHPRPMTKPAFLKSLRRLVEITHLRDRNACTAALVFTPPGAVMPTDRGAPAQPAVSPKAATDRMMAPGRLRGSVMPSRRRRAGMPGVCGSTKSPARTRYRAPGSRALGARRRP